LSTWQNKRKERRTPLRVGKRQTQLLIYGANHL
jgi:hypothetical protein